MLILHAAQVDRSLLLWAEDSEPQPGPPVHQSPREHPSCAPRQHLAEAVGLDMDDNLFTSAVAWLPSIGDAPIPSSPMAGPMPKSRAKPRIRPWTVNAISLGPDQACKLLRKCHGQRVLKTSVVIGADLAYWTHALGLAASLAARQQFLPSLSQREGRTTAAWMPLFTGDDAQRLAQLAALMPAAARALTGPETGEPPSTPGQAALREFITVHLDHLVRASAMASRVDQPEIDSAHDAWLQALGNPDPKVRASTAQLQQLRRQFAEWQRPIAVTANSPYRLCLRLEEPRPPGPEEEAQAIRQDDWYLRYLLQPHDDHSLLVAAEDLWKGQVNLLHPDFNPVEFLLSSLAQAGSACPPISDSLKRRRPSGMSLSADEAHGFLERQAAALQQAGFGVMLPAWWTRHGAKTRPRIRARTRAPAMQGGSGVSMTSLIDLDIDIALGEDTISPQELEELAALKAPLVRYRGQWVEIDPDQIRAAADFWRNRQQVTLPDVVKLGMGADLRAAEDNVSLVADGWLGDLLEQLGEKDRLEQLDAPEEFSGSLRPYQQLGYSWLAFLRKWGLGACLADDMGLGKTVQALAALELDRQQGNSRPCLLVCPTSVINNWQREIARGTGLGSRPPATTWSSPATAQ